VPVVVVVATVPIVVAAKADTEGRSVTIIVGIRTVTIVVRLVTIVGAAAVIAKRRATVVVIMATVIVVMSVMVVVSLDRRRECEASYRYRPQNQFAKCVHRNLDFLLI
jgi:hypothetical protein